MAGPQNRFQIYGAMHDDYVRAMQLRTSCAGRAKGWKRSSLGGQPLYSGLAIEIVLTSRLLLGLVLRQAGAFNRNVLGLPGLSLSVPDRSTLGRRGQVFVGRQPRVVASDGPVP